jgi:hypothetical protein
MDAATLPTIVEFDSPNPPRFWWLVRLSIVYTIALVVGVGAWFTWNAVADRRVDAEVARVRALGQPILAQDFNVFEKWPDNLNAVTYITQAARITSSAPRQELIDFDWDYKLSEPQRRLLNTFPAAFAENIRLMRQSRPLKSQRTITITSPMANVVLSNLNGEQQLARTIQAVIAAEHLDGNDAEVIECMRDLLHLSSSVDQRTVFLVEHFVAIGMSTAVADSVARLSQQISIDRAGPGTRPSKPASRQQVQALIAELLDLSELQRGQEKALQGERAGQLDTALQLPNSPSWFGRTAVVRPGGATLTGTLLAPSFKLSGVRCAQNTTEWVNLVADPTTTAANLPPMRVETPMADVTQMSRMIETLLTTSLKHACQSHFRAVVERHIAATQLAIRLYQADHQEAFPATLQELVPTYLPALPADPFASDQQPIKYVRDGIIAGIPTPLLYSVGENGIDDHGSTRSDLSSYNRWAMEDAVYPIIPPPLQEPMKWFETTYEAPTTTPSTQPSAN